MSSNPDLAGVRNCLCLAARRQARELTRLYDEHLRPHGLRATQFSVLAALSQMGTTPVSELAEFLGLERTSLTRSAALLERNGWINIQRSITDARERHLRLTSAGQQVLEDAFPAWEVAQRQAAAGVTHLRSTVDLEVEDASSMRSDGGG